MRNARSKSTFRPRWRQRTSGKKGKRASLLKGVTSSAKEVTYDPEVIGWSARVGAVGGFVSASTIDAANTFLRSIKNSSGLRAKIKRLNLIPILIFNKIIVLHRNNLNDLSYFIF